MTRVISYRCSMVEVEVERAAAAHMNSNSCTCIACAKLFQYSRAPRVIHALNTTHAHTHLAHLGKRARREFCSKKKKKKKKFTVFSPRSASVRKSWEPWRERGAAVRGLDGGARKGETETRGPIAALMPVEAPRESQREAERRAAG